MENMDMKTATKTLLSLSICLGLSGAVYAQPSGVQSDKQALPSSEVVKHKAPAAAKHKPAVPADVSADSKMKAPAVREHGAKSAQPMAASKTDKATKVERKEAQEAAAESSTKSAPASGVRATKPATKSAKPAPKAETSVEGAKNLK
jgi:hypothetical protein